jgi:hypothetical protein
MEKIASEYYREVAGFGHYLACVAQLLPFCSWKTSARLSTASSHNIYVTSYVVTAVVVMLLEPSNLRNTVW